MNGKFTHIKNGKVINPASALDAPVDINQLLLGVPNANDIIECLNKQLPFGLRSGTCFDSLITFNVKSHHIYDYSLGRFAMYNCGSYMRMLNFLRMSLKTHRIYFTSDECVAFLKEKNIITNENL